MDTKEFVETLTKNLETVINTDRLNSGTYDNQILINYFNVDRKNGCDFGVDGLNNRAMFQVLPQRNGKYKFSTTVWSFDFEWLEKGHRIKRPRAGADHQRRSLNTSQRSLLILMTWHCHESDKTLAKSVTVCYDTDSR